MTAEPAIFDTPPSQVQAGLETLEAALDSELLGKVLDHNLLIAT